LAFLKIVPWTQFPGADNPRPFPEAGIPAISIIADRDILIPIRKRQKTKSGFSVWGRLVVAVVGLPPLQNQRRGCVDTCMRTIHGF